MRYLLCLFLVFHSLWTFSQKEKTTGLWYGPNDEVPNYEWQAQWIWMNDSISSDVMLARKIVDLTTLPNRALIRITATSQYQLYVNGLYIHRGPARSAPHHQSFDILDISQKLKLGKNAIAVRVHRQRKKYSYHFEQRGGLLAQLDMTFNGEERQVFTNSDWKVSAELSWDSSAPEISRFQQIVSDRVDMRKQHTDWKTMDYDLSHWHGAIPLFRNVGWPAVQKNDKPSEIATPWISLVPRDVPYLIENQIRAENLIQAMELETNTALSNPIAIQGHLNKNIANSLKKYITNKGPLKLPKTDEGKVWFLLFDLGEVRNGTPTLSIQGASGTEIEVVGAPFLINNNFTYNILDSEYRDKIILSGRQDVWEATYFKPFRYLGIIVKGSEAPVNLFSAGTRSINYPFVKKGTMTSKEAPWVAEYMDASAKTIDVCTTDAYTDNYRERRQYAQTGYYAALGNYYLFGDTALQRRYLVQTAQEQQANGIMPAYAPAASDDYMVILDSNCLWIRSLHNYLLYSGDLKTVKELLPAAKKLMHLLDSFTNKMGMIENPPYPYWLDHALLDRRGANFNLNGHYLGALDDFAQLLEWLDNPEKESYKSKASLLRESLQKQLWNDEKQLFADALIDGKQSKMFSEHTNATALALHIATKVQADKIAKKLLVKDDHDYVRRKSGLIMVTPAMSYYLHKGLADYGYIDESFELLRSRFDKMLALNTNGTLWEEWRLDGTGRSGELEIGRTRSDAQTESAFMPELFAKYLLGVVPTKPGMKEIKIYRPKSNINQLEGSVPSPQGNLWVKWDIEMDGVKSLRLDIPGQMKLKLDLKSLVSDESASILVDGVKINQNTKVNPYYILEKGKHAIKF
ncbi:family 78 glycoside hydrolase catalytic domain [Flagellimonas algicola]|uniref:Alpha-L-rhamnosidase n=1 Tax=Flagellimonas algicola TaxID=2583815 RepID=A0ABY2WQQ1_9FLAO|nr:family 78 glycoside hydrolase catalytic domain [Allomuricauda algicola]TMU57319.1 hypothetical protein FGG15_07175 [Allomuricauda algicola]